MDKQCVIDTARLAARAERVMDEGRQTSWDGKMALREALFAAGELAEQIACENGFDGELEAATSNG